MALPGLSLPGLSSTPSIRASVAPPPAASAPLRNEEVPARSELRFEVAFDRTLKLRLTRGAAEIFGTELAANVTYTFTGCKAAVFTWEGCALELQGEAESEYMGSETEAMIEWLNAHGMLDTLRETPGSDGPRVLILGADSSGKSSLAKCLLGWALKMGRTPTYINVDPREGGVSIPAALSATTYASQLDIDAGEWGQSAISGPTIYQGRSPLIHHFPYSSPLSDPALYKAVTNRMALAVTSKLEEDPKIKSSGFIIDTSSALNRPQDNYDLASHLISEFSINVIFTLGSERLYNDILRRFPQSSSDAPAVLRLSPSPGAVTRDESFLKAHRAAQIRSYFFGDASKTSGTPLNPHSQTVPFSELAIFRVASNAGNAPIHADFLPGQDDDDDEYDPSPAAAGGAAGQKLLEKIEPSQALLNAVVAIMHAGATASHEQIRDAAVMGYVFVAEVDETRHRVRFLSPHPGRWGDRALVVGPWPDGVGDLVS